MNDEASRVDEVVGVLDDVIDPELGIGILSLGLIYKVEVHGDDVEILMTLTVPGCPMHETIAQDVRSRVGRIPWVSTAEVTMTFDPPWSLDRVSMAARRQLGYS
ncbi:MAG: metal-sulfur cluster assembly factor [Vulcanimicrobiaceae bacterium]